MSSRNAQFRRDPGISVDSGRRIYHLFEQNYDDLGHYLLRWQIKGPKVKGLMVFLMDMHRNRQDLSRWAIHFVHDYNSNSQPDGEIFNLDHYDGFPYHGNKELNDRFQSWEISDRNYPMDPDPDALQVLLKIITDGHIRAGWAFRNGRPTVYGPRAAVCFTEMPLYALVEYAKQRRSDSVGTYAVGILKKELFIAGGRPAIYGLSSTHKESNSRKGWPRYLHSSCGLSSGEQFRYVAMSKNPQRPMDWSHEREWRWTDHEDRCSCPGLPIWLSEQPISFSRVFVVVPDSNETKQVLDRLKELHDAGANDYDYPFHRDVLEKTAVIALDRLEAELANRKMDHIRLDDIAKEQIQLFAKPKVSSEFKEQVLVVLEEARAAAEIAAIKCLKTAPRTKDGQYVADVAGWAHLHIYDSQTPLISALMDLGEAFAVPGEGHYIRKIGGLGWGSHQNLCLAEAAVRAAKLVFERHFSDITFGVVTRWD